MLIPAAICGNNYVCPKISAKNIIPSLNNLNLKLPQVLMNKTKMYNISNPKTKTKNQT